MNRVQKENRGGTDFEASNSKRSVFVSAGSIPSGKLDERNLKRFADYESYKGLLHRLSSGVHFTQLRSDAVKGNAR